MIFPITFITLFSTLVLAVPVEKRVKNNAEKFFIPPPTESAEAVKAVSPIAQYYKVT